MISAFVLRHLPRYVVISAIDLEQGEIRSSCSALGAGDIVYMNADSLYIAGSNYITEDGEPYTEDVYTVQEHKSYTSTQILRYDIAADGSLAYAAGTQVNGYLDSQFSLDAYNGYLRMVVTRDNEQYATYTDERYGWVNYKWEEDSYVTDNALYILDEQLEMVGSVENLAQDEQIYSARFAGDLVYFCTYRQVDPLFAVDLRNPAQPLVLSALKISGFSEYLHPFGEHLLFGLGLEVDEDSGTTEGLKLVMFDISDPTDIFAAHSYVIDESFSSVAMYNHKAILVDAEKNLIGFPTDAGYAIYGYTEEQGFALRGSVSLQSEDWWSYDSRGLYIDDCFYILQRIRHIRAGFGCT